MPSFSFSTSVGEISILGNLEPTGNLYKQPARVSLYFVPIIIIITFTKALKGVHTMELSKRFQNATERATNKKKPTIIIENWVKKKNGAGYAVHRTTK